MTIAQAKVICRAIALLLIGLPMTAGKAQPAFNPDARVTPAQWMRNCVHNFEGENKADSDRALAMVGKPPPTHRENIQYCIYGVGTADRNLPISERVQSCVKALEGAHKAEVEGFFIMLGERPPTHEQNVQYCWKSESQRN
jgi:hypothetical protein